MIVIRKEHPFGAQAVPEHRLVGIGAFFHDPHDAGGIVGKDFKAFLARIEFRPSLVKRVGGINDDDQPPLGSGSGRVEFVEEKSR